MIKKQPKLTHTFALSIFLLALLAPMKTWGESTKEEFANEASEGVKERIEMSKLRFQLGPSFTSIRSSSSSLSGVGATGAFLISLHENWQAGFGMQQVFSTSSFSTLATSLDLRILYALTGTLMPKKTYRSMQDKDVAVSTEHNVGGIRLQLSISQNFVKFSSTSSLPYAGIGGGFQYDFPSSTLGNFYLGSRVERLSNGGTTLYPIQFQGGFALWL